MLLWQFYLADLHENITKSYFTLPGGVVVGVAVVAISVGVVGTSTNIMKIDYRYTKKMHRFISFVLSHASHIIIYTYVPVLL